MPVELKQGTVTTTVRALVDLGANGIGYVNRHLARQINLILKPLVQTIYPTKYVVESVEKIRYNKKRRRYEYLT